MPQLTLLERYTISVLLKEERSKAYIAQAIGKNKTTIYRELNRNRDQRTREYKPELAQRKTDSRHKQKAKHIRLTPSIKQYAEQLMITKQYSPEQVCGNMKSQGMETVSHETLYLHVWKDENKEERYIHTCEGKNANTVNEETRKIHEG